MKECFVKEKFTKVSLGRISLINQIIEEYQNQGFGLTLRQLYYQLVSRDIIPNNPSEYDKIGYLVNKARRNGLIDWDAIEDRTRYLRWCNHFTGPGDAIHDTAMGYSIDLWDGQPNHLEVWCEKDAVIDIVGQACRKFDVDFMSCRGNCSTTEAYKAGKRLERKAREGKNPIILYLGDHDPNGLDMTRDIKERLEEYGRINIDIQRIALTIDQINQYALPPNPVKKTDTRCKSYIEKYGELSWELDALEPKVLVDLIETSIIKHLDMDAFKARECQEREERDFLLKAANQWSSITQFLR